MFGVVGRLTMNMSSFWTGEACWDGCRHANDIIYNQIKARDSMTCPPGTGL